LKNEVNFGKTALNRFFYKNKPVYNPNNYTYDAILSSRQI